jgi:hypothetical protein
MTSLAIVLLAVATCLAAGTALWIALHLMNRQRRLEERKASVLRAQLLAHFRAIREFIAPRSRPLDLLQKEMYEPLQYLWMLADLLEAEELRAINHCGSMLLALRHKPSVNHTQARMAEKLIDETCSVLLRYEQMAGVQNQYWSPLPGLLIKLPSITSIGTGRQPSDAPGPATPIGMAKT